MTDATDDLSELFPESVCVAAIGELSAWTSVADIAAAGRCLAGAPAPGDVFTDTLLLPFTADDRFQAAHIKALGWFIEAYRVPPAKIVIAAQLEACLTAAHQQTLHDALFRPDIDLAPPGSIAQLQGHHDKRVFVVNAPPHMIELVQTPLRCIGDMFSKHFDMMLEIEKLNRLAAETSDEPLQILHKPYADSQMPAILEALTFHSFGLAFGPFRSPVGGGRIEIGYRTTTVVAQPPIDTRLLDAAGEGLNLMVARSL